MWASTARTNLGPAALASRLKESYSVVSERVSSSGPRNRTSIHGIRNRRPTIERVPIEIGRCPTDCLDFVKVPSDLRWDDGESNPGRPGKNRLLDH